eukprot:TRINITY_DN65039_c0_g1_i1.p1 TRINITY_DN65039_c0_g1~~TRINITY_DN65039_c0_g1_i1.p1  ORF type:complete len:919 (+),score=224.63 TRINITY_DN65039_c0_g1_i1:133-2889(+)
MPPLRRPRRRLARCCLICCAVTVGILHIPLVAAIYSATRSWRRAPASRQQYDDADSAPRPPARSPTPPPPESHSTVGASQHQRGAGRSTAAGNPTTPPTRRRVLSDAEEDTAAAAALRRLSPLEAAQGGAESGAAASWGLQSALDDGGGTGTASPLLDRMELLRLGAAVAPPVLRFGDGLGVPEVSVVVPLFGSDGGSAPAEDGQGWFGALQGLYASEGPEWVTSFEVVAVPRRGELAPPWLRRWPLLRVARRRGGSVGVSDSIAAAWRDGAAAATADRVLLLLGDAAPAAPGFITEMLRAHRAAGRVGDSGGSPRPAAVSPRVITGGPQPHPKRAKRCLSGCTLSSFGAAAAEGMDSDPVLHRRWAGLNTQDSRVTRVDAAPGLLVVPQCFIADKALVLNTSEAVPPLGSPALSLSGASADAWALAASASLRAVQQGGAVRVTPNAECHALRDAQDAAEGGPHLSTMPEAFRVQWGPVLAAPRDPHVRVVWDTFCIKCFGFTNEVMHYVVPLERLAPVKSQQGADCFCPGTPLYFTQALRRLHSPKGWERRFRSQRDQWERGGEVVVWVSHKDPGSFSKHYGALGRRPDYIVGRSMYEFTRVDPAWIPKANDADLADEIWVPSAFVHAVFKANGIQESKLVVVPEPVDVHFFDPRVTQPYLLPARFQGWRAASTHPSPPSFNESAPPYSLRKNYKFLSVFKWEERKGWDVLLDAYFKTFTARDPVSLYLLCYLWEDADSRNPKRILGLVRGHAKQLGLDLAQLPHVEVITEQLSEADMARVYRSCDAFVMPTRGEGWGLPIIQAMAMGMPAIATNWSGNVDFMRPGASLLLRVDRLAPVPQGTPYGTAEGKVWAEPSSAHLAELMRRLVSAPEWGCEVGRKARHLIVANYADEVIAEVVKRRLDAIRDIVLAKRRRR